ncbi:hypothetical protein D3C78_1011620 [compost metagenome]
MVTGTKWVGFRIQQHHYAVALIAVHQEEPQNRDKGRQQHGGYGDQFPAHAGQEQHEQAGGGNQNRSPQIGLRGDQQGRQENQHQRNRGIL